MFFRLVLTEVVEQKFFLIGINRPEKRNCVNHATAKQLIAAFEEFNRRDDLLSAVLYGNGMNALLHRTVNFLMALSLINLLFSFQSRTKLDMFR